tara:strand:- start:20 stop:484 length:465 start_codon:yes stop_codon:yes gene_type:complete
MFIAIPLTLKKANDFVTEHHRHSKRCRGHKFSIGANYEGDMIGVAMCGRPLSRRLDEQFTLEVLRVCIKEPIIKNACSFLYGRCARIWREMGGKKILTYTLEHESGSSMKAVGWKRFETQDHFKKGKYKGWKTRDKREAQSFNSSVMYRWEMTF